MQLHQIQAGLADGSKEKEKALYQALSEDAATRNDWSEDVEGEGIGGVGWREGRAPSRADGKVEVEAGGEGERRKRMRGSEHQLLSKWLHPLGFGCNINILRLIGHEAEQSICGIWILGRIRRWS